MNPVGEAADPTADSGEPDEPVNLFEAAAAQQQGGRGGAAARGATAPGTAGAGAGNVPAGTNLEFLRENQTFQHLRQLIQQQPNMLETVLQQLANANPQLAQMINNNPEQFLQLLAEGGGEEGGPAPPGVQQVAVTPEERDAIERVGLQHRLIWVTNECSFAD